MEEVVKAVKSSKPVVIYDEKSVLAIPAEVVSVEVVKIMMKYCDEIRVALPWKRIVELGLNRYKVFNGNAIPLDFKSLSAKDRAEFMKILARGKLDLNDVIYPGRIFVEEAKEGGVLEILCVQPPGKKCVAATAYGNGFKGRAKLRWLPKKASS